MPTLPGKQCRVIGCKERAPAGNNGYCAKHKNHGWKMYQDANPDRIYADPRWRKVRILCIRKANGLCEMCFKRGLFVRGKDVDHIIPISQGGAPFDIDNLQYLCEDCHDHKTAKE